MLDVKRKGLARNVLDFSLAQQKGIIAAYMDVFNIKDRNEAVAQIKGCQEHFCQSVTRIKRNRAVIQAKEANLFQTMCEGLLAKQTKGGETHKQKVDAMRRRFPKVKKWLDWWSMADVEAMLFPSRRSMLEDSPNGNDGIPSTTNAQESMHRVYYMFSAGKKPLLLGMIELFGFVKALKTNWRLITRGTTIGYGSESKKQIGVAQLLGWKKPTKRQREVNNGRAPDTTATLALDSQPAKKRARLGRPPNAPNVDRNPITTFLSYGASNDYKRHNRCWLYAVLESLYAVYSPLWLQRLGGKKNEVFYNVVTHFTS
ncbi:hypothetical protein PCANC_28038 [Puccinia coronata f. sp. avenae]|uniref:Uncharacterized protein n=1 Tax=Puccinia coronata f. sp. avenae TaxID=200324 RepID=A0A2N5TE36_9BASI|nr:hypothetical protein PCANC_28038 [Puccinia coronata f. sp. avenae]